MRFSVQMGDLALNGVRGNSSQTAEGKTKYTGPEAMGGQVVDGRELVEARSLLRVEEEEALEI